MHLFHASGKHASMMPCMDAWMHPGIHACMHQKNLEGFHNSIYYAYSWFSLPALGRNHNGVIVCGLPLRWRIHASRRQWYPSSDPRGIPPLGLSPKMWGIDFLLELLFIISCNLNTFCYRFFKLVLYMSILVGQASHWASRRRCGVLSFFVLELLFIIFT